ncbi:MULTISPECIES: ABC transporter permease [unclassified Polaromonas]|uniref:ABC transporter permease n=1 Tax=unclassified Polaromonas TaxID=2638319 RepID=UPI0025D975C9|nr:MULTISPECIES: ABC transporter permease [unclassified Polaromonas]HQS01129.1 ABC transporter permease [Polaromonas sp.]HQS42259.1 ABC transporter permease [Polaromonas sp.]HQS85708.1 ABC transporter permease [Polaromonas sp.]HQT05614.1 ABC transporter permease [Polaromonas sp.]
MRARSYRLWGVLLLVLLLVLWQVSALWWVSSTSWPPVTEILKAIAAGLANGELAQVFGSTLWRMAIGFAIGSAAGVLLGITMATFPLADAALRPLVELLRPIPMPAIVPPLILLLGIDHAMKVFAVSLACFFPVLVNTVGGVRAVDPTALDVARTFQVGRLRTLLQVVLLASLPFILAGLRTSLALALIVSVVAEMIAGSEGIGYYIMTMQYAMRPSDMYAAIFLLAAMGYGLNLALLAVERRLLHWWQRGDD